MSKYIYILFISIIVSACSASYSFTGTSVGDAQTISIETLTNRDPLTPPQYTQSLTEAIKETFLRQTSLDLVKTRGDMQISGFIQKYYSGPIATTGNETTAQNRLTMTVKIDFVNELDPTQNFSKSFTRFEDYASTQSLSQVQDQLFLAITEQLTQDIIQAAIGNW